MKVNFKKNSWHARLYKRAFAVYILPANLCPYFWSTVWVLITLPVSWIGMVCAPHKEYFNKFITGAASYAFLLIFTLLGHKINMETHWWSDPYWIGYTLIGAGVVVLCACLVIGILIGVAWCVQTIWNKIENWLTNKPKEKDTKSRLFFVAVQAKAKNLCPIINWD